MYHEKKTSNTSSLNIFIIMIRNQSNMTFQKYSFYGYIVLISNVEYFIHGGILPFLEFQNTAVPHIAPTIIFPTIAAWYSH